MVKKVLIFSLAYFPKHVGGAEIAIQKITDRINPDDIEFHMVTNRYDSTLPRTEKIGNVLVHRIGFTRENPQSADLKKFPLHLNKYLYQFLAPLNALALHRRNRYDAIWAMMAHSCGVPAALFKIAHPNIPYLLTLQEGDPPEHVENMMRPVWPLFKRAFTKADVVQAISVFLGAWARRRGFKGMLEVVPNAVEAKHFGQTYPDPVINEIKDALGKKMGDVFLIHTGRIVHKNGLDDVIRALPLLPANVHFFMIGEGHEQAALQKLAKDLSVVDRVHVHPYVHVDEVPKFLRASDIFIRPSRSEGMGNSFVEAMAAGLPVIATQEGGIADFLFDEKRNPDKPITGWAVDRDSPDQIATAVKDIMARPEKVRAVVATARQMVIEKYDWDIIARDMREKVFRRLLGI